jgi:diguanylate cyclase (GGDEF)-like protein
MSDPDQKKDACGTDNIWNDATWYLLQTITPLARQINCLDLQQIGKICVEEIPKLISARFASLYILDETNDMLQLKNRNHPFLINNTVSINQDNLSLMSKAVRNKELIVIEHSKGDKSPVISECNRKYTKNYQSNTCIIAPLICHNMAVGVLNLADKIGSERFSNEDLAVIELIRQLIGASIGNIKLFEKTQHQAKTDGLTELVNHRTFYEILERELRRCQRYGNQLSVIMVDIDNLKPINDSFGHRAGDTALKRISRKIVSCIRKIDIAARYGGDEFAIILPNTPLSEAVIVARRIVQEVSSTSVVWEGQKIKISVSVGVGQCEGETCPEDITRHSDEALYAAKQAGGNTFRTFDTLQSPA